MLESSGEEEEVPPHPNRKQRQPEGPHPHRKPVAKEAKAWIKEGTGDDPVNFMDPVVVKSIFGE